MASMMSPLEKERSIEVIQLTCALLEERTRTPSTAEGDIFSSSRVKNSPDSSLLGTSSVTNIDMFTMEKPSEESGKAKEMEEPAGDMTPLKTETESSSVSSEKENKNVPRKKIKNKKRRGFLRFLKAKSVQGKPPRNGNKKNVPTIPAETETPEYPTKPIVSNSPTENKVFEQQEQKSTSYNLVREPSKAQRTTDKVVASPHVTKTTAESDEKALAKAKEYTRMSTALLDSLKNDDGAKDVRESIRQAKLAYEYAMKARQLYSSVRDKNTKPLCDGSINEASVDTEKAGNVTGMVLSNVNKEEQADSNDSKASRADTQQSSLLMDSTGKEVPADSNLVTSPDSIEIEHDENIRFETPVAHSSSRRSKKVQSGIHDMLQFAGSFRKNKGGAVKSKSEATASHDSIERPLSPLSSILGLVEKNVQTEASPTTSTINANDVEKIAEGTEMNIEISTEEESIDASVPHELSRSPFSATHTAQAIGESSNERAAILTTMLEDTRELKRELSNVIHPPALHPSRSSVSASSSVARERVGTTLQHLPIRSLLSQDTESAFSDYTPRQDQSLNRPKTVEALKEGASQEKRLVKTFPVIKCGSGLACVAGGEKDTKPVAGGEENVKPQDGNQKGSTRITVIDEKDEYERGRVARHEHKVRGQQLEGKTSGTVWQRAQEELKEVQALAREILNGEVNVIDEVNPFVCRSGAVRVKPTFDDESYSILSHDESEEVNPFVCTRGAARLKPTFDDESYSIQSHESEEVNPFVCSRGAVRGKPTFDDETNTTFSHGSGSLLTDDDEQTYETMSYGSMVDTAGRRRKTSYEGFEVFEKSKESAEEPLEQELKETFHGDWNATFEQDWKATFDDSEWKETFNRTEDSSEGSLPSFPFTQEMKIVGTASSGSESETSDESSDESDDDGSSDVSSISSASLQE